MALPLSLLGRMESIRMNALPRLLYPNATVRAT